MRVLLLVFALAAVVPCGSNGQSSGVAKSTIWERSLAPEARRFAVGELADLDGDGAPEVLVQLGYRDEPSRVIALAGATGSELWRRPFGGRMRAAAADLDGDGRAEVVAACGDTLVALSGYTGAVIASRRLPGALDDMAVGHLGGASSPHAGIRGGEVTSVVCTCGDGRADVLIALSGLTLDELWRMNAVEGDGPFARGFGRPAVVEADGEGVIIVAENGGTLNCINARGERRWGVSLGACERLNPEGVVSSQAIVGDLIPGAPPEVAVGCFAGALVVLDFKTGEELSRSWFGRESHESHLANSLVPGFIRKVLEATGEPVNCVTAVRLDDVRGKELVLGCSDGFLYACTPYSGDRVWRIETDGDVYDPVLPVRVEHAAGPALLAWSADGAWLVEGSDGRAVPLFGDSRGASCVLAGDLTGDGRLEVVRFGPDGGTVRAISTDLEPWTDALVR